MSAIVIVPDTSISYSEFIALAHDAEEANFSHVFIPEGVNDGLMCAYAVAIATRRITIGTYTSNIYFREPPLCAASAQMVQDAANGRFLLGLGVGHRQSQSALGIKMDNPRQKLRDFTISLRRLWSGESHPDFPVTFRAPEPPIPIYYATTTLQTARLAGELADGLELYLSSATRTLDVAKAASDAAVANGRPADAVAIAVGLPTFVDEDLEAARQRARANLMYHLALPNYNRQLERSGFEAEAAELSDAAARQDFEALSRAVTDEMLDATCLIGPAARCVEQLEAYRSATGPDVLPIVFPFPFTGDYAGEVRTLLKVFGTAH